jgi:hypothetical protein
MQEKNVAWWYFAILTILKLKPTTTLRGTRMATRK